VKKNFISILIISSSVFAQPQFSEMGASVGAFSRMGFGARGIGMGNAMTAVTSGELVSYYNPAATVFQEKNSVLTGYSFLSVDRNLNFLSFTRRFDFYSKKDSLVENPKPRNSAGFSIGVINAGVSKIDGRDNNGLPTGELSTSENQFFLAVANRFSEKFSIGITAKFYYYKLYEDITSTSLGVDIGALYKINEQFTIAVAVVDINSKYKWDTSPVYETDGVVTEDKFPNLRKIGVSYHNKALGLLAAIELENSSKETNILRAGVEYNIYDGLFLRGGIDQVNLNNKDWPVKPSLGFSFYKSFGNFIVGVDYAFAIEQYSTSDRHIVGLTFNF
jgi:opacity protein-like surface antigen